MPYVHKIYLFCKQNRDTMWRLAGVQVRKGRTHRHERLHQLWGDNWWDAFQHSGQILLEE
jgi:hypothetical protein